MGRHNAPEGRHRRSGALLAQAGLIAVLGLVAVAVLFGSGLARNRMVDGTFAAAPEAAAPTSEVDVPATTPEPSTARSAPPSETDAPSASAAPSSERVTSPETRGASASLAPTSQESATASADTTATPEPSASASATPPASTTTSAPTPPSSTTAETFANCADAQAAGVSVIPSGDPRYSANLDHDGDGYACDRHGDPPTPPTPVPATGAAPVPTRCVATGR